MAPKTTTTIVDCAGFRIEADMMQGDILHVSWIWKDGRENWLESVTLVGSQIDALSRFIAAGRKAEAA